MWCYSVPCTSCREVSVDLGMFEPQKKQNSKPSPTTIPKSLDLFQPLTTPKCGPPPNTGTCATAPYTTLLYVTVPYVAISCHSTLCPSTLCHSTLCRNILCHSTLCPSTLCPSTLCPSTLCHSTSVRVCLIPQHCSITVLS